MPRQKSTKAALTPRQAEIVAVATELIAEMGIQQLTMKKVAQRLGFSEPAIYRHFDSKADVLLAIVSGFRIYGAELLEEVVALQAPALDKVKALFSGFIGRFVEHPEITAVIFAEEIFQDDERLATSVREIMTNNHRLLLRIIRGGQRADEIRKDVSAEALLVVIMGAFRLKVTSWRLSNHEFDLNKAGRELWKALATILAPPA